MDALSACMLPMTPALWYSPTRRSKKFVFPLQFKVPPSFSVRARSCTVIVHRTGIDAWTGTRATFPTAGSTLSPVHEVLAYERRRNLPEGNQLHPIERVRGAIQLRDSELHLSKRNHTPRFFHPHPLERGRLVSRRLVVIPIRALALAARGRPENAPVIYPKRTRCILASARCSCRPSRSTVHRGQTPPRSQPPPLRSG